MSQHYNFRLSTLLNSCGSLGRRIFAFVCVVCVAILIHVSFKSTPQRKGIGRYTSNACSLGDVPLTQAQDNPRVPLITKQTTVNIKRKLSGILLPNDRIKKILKECHASPASLFQSTLSTSGETSAIYVTTHTSRTGRLGDKMFSYASLIGLTLAARDRGLCVVPVVDNKSNLYPLSNAFRLEKIDGVSEYNAFVEVVEDYPMTFSPHLLQVIQPGHNYTILRYLQSWRYFQYYSLEIRQLFRFKEDILEEAVDCLLSLVDTSDESTVLVGVYIHRGETHTSSLKAESFAPVDLSFVNNALNYYRATFSSVLFVLCTDNMDWVLKHIPGEDIRFSTGHREEVDMAILSLCDHSVVTSGTLSWWSAWLAGGTAVFNKLSDPGFLLESRFSSDDYYPPLWIGMT